MTWITSLSGVVAESVSNGEFRGYRLGSLGNLEAFAEVGSGAVRGISKLSGNNYFINSSVAQYVEISWRMYRLQLEPYMEEMDEEADFAAAQLLGRANEIDPLIGNDPSATFWAGELAEWT